MLPDTLSYSIILSQSVLPKIEGILAGAVMPEAHPIHETLTKEAACTMWVPSDPVTENEAMRALKQLLAIALETTTIGRRLGLPLLFEVRKDASRPAAVSS